MDAGGFISFLKERYPRLPAGGLYPLLLAASYPFEALVRFRNRLYDRSILRTVRAGVPVVSVGNLTVGGTGKTPLVLRTVEEALRRGLRPAVVSRGYKAPEGRLNDEGVLVARDFPGAKVLQDPDRASAARRAVQEGADFLVLDDGFQHRRLHRDADVVLVDAVRPFGFGRVLPAGLLREPAAGLSRAHLVVVSRSDRVSRGALRRLEETLARLAPEAVFFRGLFRPTRLRDPAGGAEEDAAALAGRRVYAFCGLANPAAFEEDLAGLGARIAGRTRFPDHHAYGEGDLERVKASARAAGAEVVVTTAKDGVKIAGMDAAAGVRVLEGRFHIQEGEDRFWTLLFERAGVPGTSLPRPE